jgi:outer membrane receptor protein involved in Fe transport
MKRLAAATIVIGAIVAQALPASAPTTAYAAATTTTTLVPAPIMAKWQKVAWCESHANWTQKHEGPHAFSGALGIRNDVWLAHGGARFGLTPGDATPQEQVVIAREIERRGGAPGYVPDQDGYCSGW